MWLAATIQDSVTLEDNQFQGLLEIKQENNNIETEIRRKGTVVFQSLLTYTMILKEQSFYVLQVLLFMVFLDFVNILSTIKKSIRLVSIF